MSVWFFIFYIRLFRFISVHLKPNRKLGAFLYENKWSVTWIKFDINEPCLCFYTKQFHNLTLFTDWDIRNKSEYRFFLHTFLKILIISLVDYITSLKRSTTCYRKFALSYDEWMWNTTSTIHKMLRSTIRHLWNPQYVFRFHSVKKQNVTDRTWIPTMTTRLHD